MDGCSMAMWAAIVWLLYRIWHCMRIPVQDFLEVFNVSVSKAKIVSIEEITENSVVLRWENEGFDQKTSCPVLYYSLFVNGLKVGSFPNNNGLVCTYCSLNNLKPATEYKIDVITFTKEGFVTKIPSLYFMTRSSNLCEEGKEVTVDLGADGYLYTKLVPGLTMSAISDAQWQKPTLLSKCQLKCKVKQDSSCSSLLSILDLEDIPISKLKQILLCSQDELHEILLQQETADHEFNTARRRLLLEVEELRHRWNQESESKRTLKTILKSLENSKVLSDLKKNKLVKQLTHRSAEIQKMYTDMEQWELEKEKLDVGLLEKEYNATQQSMERHISSVEEELADIQKEVLLLEAENKQLNYLRRNWGLTKEENNYVTSPVSPQSLMKKFTIFESELNEDVLRQDIDFLKGLPQDMAVVQFLKEELSKDLQLEMGWNAKYSQYLQQIAELFKIRDDISMSNKRYRAALATQPYCQLPAHVVESVAQNADSTTLMNVPPHLQLHDPSTYGETKQLSPLFMQNLGNVYPQHSGSNYIPWTQTEKSHTNSKDDANLSGMLFQAEEEEETPFGQDDSNHLLSSLKSMISEPEVQNNTPNNNFTTNELDNYWNYPNSCVPGDRPDEGGSHTPGDALLPIGRKPLLRNPSSSRTIESIKFMKQEADESVCDAPLLYNIDDSQSEDGTQLSVKMQQQDSYIRYLPQIKDGACSPEPNFYSVNFNIWHDVSSSDPNATLSPKVCSDNSAALHSFSRPQLHLQDPNLSADKNSQSASNQSKQ